MIGWTDLTAANAYFSAGRLVSTFWDALITESGGKDEKSAVLSMAYDRIRFCRDFDIPDTLTAKQLSKLAYAQHELAYYLAEHLADEDRRKGIQAQAVGTAGIVHETFEKDHMGKLAIPAVVREALDEFNRFNRPFYATDLDRDEDVSVSSDPTGESF